MPTVEQYIAQIADLSYERDLGEEVGTMVDATDPLMIGHDALTYFRYTGDDEPKAKGEFLRAIRNLLEIRFDELEQLGHKTTKLTLVEIDKLLNNLDLLQELDSVSGVRGLITGDIEDLIKPTSIFKRINENVSKIDQKIGAISKALAERQFYDLEPLLKDFDDAREALRKELGNVKHSALRKHLATVLCAAGDNFASGETYRISRTAVVNKVKSMLSFAWSDALKAAEDSFHHLTEKSGKKMPLSAAVKIDPSFEKALIDVDEKSKKGLDVTTEKEKASQLGIDALKTLDNVPEKLKEAEPRFFDRLHSTVWGIVTTLKSK